MKFALDSYLGSKLHKLLEPKSKKGPFSTTLVHFQAYEMPQAFQLALCPEKKSQQTIRFLHTKRLLSSVCWSWMIYHLGLMRPIEIQQKFREIWGLASSTLAGQQLLDQLPHWVARARIILDKLIEWICVASFRPKLWMSQNCTWAPAENGVAMDTISRFNKENVMDRRILRDGEKESRARYFPKKLWLPPWGIPNR